MGWPSPIKWLLTMAHVNKGPLTPVTTICLFVFVAIYSNYQATAPCHSIEAFCPFGCCSGCGHGALCRSQVRETFGGGGVWNSLLVVVVIMYIYIYTYIQYSISRLWLMEIFKNWKMPTTVIVVFNPANTLGLEIFGPLKAFSGAVWLFGSPSTDPHKVFGRLA